MPPYLTKSPWLRYTSGLGEGCRDPGSQKPRAVPGPLTSRVPLTSAGHSSKDPALAILDALAAVILPATQDVHAADPEHGADAIPVVVVPASQQHALVIIAVDLQPARASEGPSLGKG